jgi:hypothetical protein
MTATTPVSIISPVTEEDDETQQSFVIFREKLEAILLDPKIADKQVLMKILF